MQITRVKASTAITNAAVVITESTRKLATKLSAHAGALIQSPVPSLDLYTIQELFLPLTLRTAVSYQWLSVHHPFLGRRSEIFEESSSAPLARFPISDQQEAEEPVTGAK